MKRRMGFALIGIVMVCGDIRAGEDSAFGALRTARQSADTGALAELEGERGEPRPREWKFIFNDPSARGGVREVVISGQAIVSQRTPLRGYAGIGAQPAIIQSRLNFDSDAAFEVANRQAQARLVGFDWVDYSLRPDNVTGKPLWVLRLYDRMGVMVGVTQISAEDGSIILPLEVTQAPPLEKTGRFENSPAGRKVGGVIGTVGGVVEGTANKVKDATLRTVGTVQEALTGDRTIGPKNEDE